MPGYPKPYQPSDAELLRRASHGGSRTELARACGSNLTGLNCFGRLCWLWQRWVAACPVGRAQVCLVERDRLIWMLLHHRARHIPRTETICDQARNVLQAALLMVIHLSAKLWNVVLLDPMFPPIGKKALPNRGLQHLRQLTENSLVGNSKAEEELPELLALAKARCSGRVVIKRRLKDRSQAGWTGRFRGRVFVLMCILARRDLPIRCLIIRCNARWTDGSMICSAARSAT